MTIAGCAAPADAPRAVAAAAGDVVGTTGYASPGRGGLAQRAAPFGRRHSAADHGDVDGVAWELASNAHRARAADIRADPSPTRRCDQPTTSTGDPPASSPAAARHDPSPRSEVDQGPVLVRPAEELASAWARLKTSWASCSQVIAIPPWSWTVSAAIWSSASEQ